MYENDMYTNPKMYGNMSLCILYCIGAYGCNISIAAYLYNVPATKNSSRLATDFWIGTCIYHGACASVKEYHYISRLFV